MTNKYGNRDRPRDRKGALILYFADATRCETIFSRRHDFIGLDELTF